MESVFETEVGGRKLIVRTGKYSEQANGTCWVQCGETIVQCAVTMSETPRDGIDFFPLGVDFEEKMYSVGKIPGGFKKREGKASDKAILTSRLIDRPLRPLFPKGFYNDVAVVCTALSVDPNVAPEPLAMIASSVALSISDIPFAGPTGSVVVGSIGDKFIINPTSEENERSDMHVTVSGTKEAILMVEAGAHEVSEQKMLDAIMFAHEEIKKLVEFQEDIVKKIGKEKRSDIVIFKPTDDIDREVRKYADSKLDSALDTFDRETRQARQEEVENDTQEHFKEIFPDSESMISEVLYKMTKEKVRSKILNKGVRPDGRSLKEIRPIWCEVGVLPRVHGSAVFTRGQTQVLNCCTLGTLGEGQKLDGLDDIDNKRYIHQYNMPPYATGEARPLKSPGRREIGHGALAERALEAVIPSEEEFLALKALSDEDYRESFIGAFLHFHLAAAPP